MFRFAAELKPSAAKRNSALIYGTISGATGVESLFRRGGVYSSAAKLRAEGARFAAEVRLRTAET